MSSEPASESKPDPEPVTTSEPAAAEAKATAVTVPVPVPPGAGTPEGDRYAEALRAFEVGDYRRVRELCRGLSEARQDDVARAARDLDARTRVDSFQVVILCACLAFFSWIAYVYVIR